jgi:predicted phosphodiesterase
MRIAVLADIHGNLAAFQAALDHVATQKIDRLVIAGDVVNGSPDSAACWRLAQELACPIVRGNHERYVAHYGTPEAHPSWASAQFGPVRWSAAQCSAEQRSAMAGLPAQLTLAEAPDVCIVHGSARSDRDSVAPYTPEVELEQMFGGVGAPLIVRAHNHAPQVRQWRGGTIVTAGSVGLPLDGNPAAQYLILEGQPGAWKIAHQAVPYDVEATLARFREDGYLEVSGPIGLLFMREVATAAHHLVPFLRAYERWSQAQPITLGTAVERFLRSI